MTTLLSAPQMSDRIGGLTLWGNEIAGTLGMKPAGSTASGHGWTEEQFREICDKLIARLQAAKKTSEDNEL